MRAKCSIWLPLILFAGQNQFVCAQTPANPTADQLMQLMRTPPGVDISAPVTATATFDPLQVRPGEKAIYRVTFNATAVSVNWPEKIPAPPELKTHLSASGQTMLPVGNEYENFATFDYDVRTDAPGNFRIPQFTVEIYGKPVVIPAAQLEVQSELPSSHEPVRQLILETTALNVFIGETFDVSVVLPARASGGIEGVSDVQFNGGNFVVDKNAARQSIRMMDEDGRRAPAYVYKTSLTPIAAGKLNLWAQGFTMEMRNGQPAPILLDCEPITINVRPLPSESELPGFNGLVGSYTCDPPSLATNTLKVGEPVQLIVVIRGPKYLNRINPPPPRAEDWQIFPAKRGQIVPGAENPGMSFQYTLIPLTEKISGTPKITFSCFDPVSGIYVDLAIPSLPVTILAGKTITDADAAMMLDQNASEPENKIALSKLARSPGWSAGSLVPLQMRGWFQVAQIFPAPVFFGFWLWIRRRRYFEQHPEIVRRRQARRALRGELRLMEQAAKKNEADFFCHHAVSALQIVAAPHYPATPRALVCADILQILTSSERAGKSGEIVRQFFAAADAAAFANSPASKNYLLAEESALKEILKTLEARL